MKLEARVTRKIRDLVLDSAEELLRRKAPEVTSVTRVEVWSFEVEDATADAGSTFHLDITDLTVRPA